MRTLLTEDNIKDSLKSINLLKQADTWRDKTYSFADIKSILKRVGMISNWYICKLFCDLAFKKVKKGQYVWYNHEPIYIGNWRAMIRKYQQIIAAPKANYQVEDTTTIDSVSTDTIEEVNTIVASDTAIKSMNNNKEMIEQAIKLLKDYGYLVFKQI